MTADVLRILEALPPVAYIDNPKTAAGTRLFSQILTPVIAIRRGEPTLYPIATDAQADDFNRLNGVSARQREAMLHGAALGWHTRHADPANYDDDGRPLR